MCTIGRAVKKKIFNNLNVKCNSDNKTFWKVTIMYFSNKSNRNEKVSLAEENKIIIRDKASS